MINVIDAKLKQEGYRFLQIEQREAGVYYRYVEGVARVVIGLYAHPGFWMDADRLEQLKQDIRELFLHPQGRIQEYPQDTAIYDVKLLVLVVTLDAERHSRLCKEKKDVWLYDMKENRLMIYDNQPDDFYGLREIMQSVMESAERSDVSGASGKKRKRAWNQIPIVTILLVVFNVGVFLVLMCMGDTEDALFMLEHGAMYPELVVQNGEWYRLFTCTFLHFGAAHLANNMLMLVLAGMHLERALGKIKYAMLYILSGLGSSLLSLVWMERSGDIAVSAGASGAVFGIVGALIWVAVRNKGKFEGLTTKGLLFMAVMCLYYGFTSAGVDNWGHIGGLVSGFVLGILLYRKKQACADTFHRVY